MTDPKKTTNQSRPKADSTNNQLSIINAKANPISRIPRDEKMKNEPNFTPKPPTKHANGANFSPNFPSEIHKKCELLLKKHKEMRTFPIIYPPKAALCNFLTLTHLTTCTTMTYITFSLSNTLQERNLPAVFVAGKYAKRTQFTKHQESRIKNRASKICKTNPIYQYAIRHTQYDIRVNLCKTNPI